MAGSSPHTRGARGTPLSLTRYEGDHPRIRGEHHGEVAEVEAAVGIIPAYAGSTQVPPNNAAGLTGSSPHTRGALERVRQRYVELGDHPRIRGEHLVHFVSFVRWTRIIPAYAGSTDSSCSFRLRCLGSSPHTRGAHDLILALGYRHEDHPRIRGEHPVKLERPRGDDEIIPAYAGSTQYPVPYTKTVSGSSPHTRGAPA